MRATLLSKMGLVALVVLVFTGCAKEEPKPQYKYIKTSCPEVTTLKPIPQNYYVNDFKLSIKEFDSTHYVVDKSQLERAAKTSQQKSVLIRKQQKYIKFYESQNNAIKKHQDKK